MGHASLLTLGNVGETGMVTDVYKSKFSITFLNFFFYNQPTDDIREWPHADNFTVPQIPPEPNTDTFILHSYRPCKHRIHNTCVEYRTPWHVRMNAKHFVCTDQLFFAGKRTRFGVESTRQRSPKLKLCNLI